MVICPATGLSPNGALGKSAALSKAAQTTTCVASQIVARSRSRTRQRGAPTESVCNGVSASIAPTAQPVRMVIWLTRCASPIQAAMSAAGTTMQASSWSTTDTVSPPSAATQLAICVACQPRPSGKYCCRCALVTGNPRAVRRLMGVGWAVRCGLSTPTGRSEAPLARRSPRSMRVMDQPRRDSACVTAAPARPAPITTACRSAPKSLNALGALRRVTRLP